MTFEQLWAPWRMGYITGADKSNRPSASQRPLAWEQGADERCFLCRGVADDSPEGNRENLVVGRSPQAIAVLNRYPYNNGHLLIAPRRHVGRIDALTDAQHLDIMRLLARTCATLERLMKPAGFNIGCNLGSAAGAGVPDHLHWHVVPRWNGDTNFMPLLAGVNVIPQSLEALFELLHEALAEDRTAAERS